MEAPTPHSVDARFAELVATMAGRDDVAMGTGNRGFGSGTLTVGGRIFAMISHGRLVLKLPGARVAELIATGIGTPFDAGKGRPMKEWLALTEAVSGELWQALAGEARAFVARTGVPRSRS